jgi:hypothetical protein
MALFSKSPSIAEDKDLAISPMTSCSGWGEFVERNGSGNDTLGSGH